MAKYDVVVRNGTVVDGSGSPPYRADVGLMGDRIAEIGRIRDSGTEEIDAEGHYVSPGFIEVHTHMDAQVWWNPFGTCSSWHGITTAVMGNCGFTLAPCAEADKDLVMRSLERAEDISRDAMLSGIDWQWETYPQYLDALERVPKAINYAGYVGHSALRTYAMGERAFEEEATEADLAAMTRELQSSIRAGALGMSTSRNYTHTTSDDRLVPSRLAGWSEVEALVGAMGELGAGIFELVNEHHLDPVDRAAYQDWLCDLTVATGRPITYVIVPKPDVPTLWQECLAQFERAAARGGHMFGQAHSRAFLSVIGFNVKLPFDRLPGWAEMRKLPLEQQKAALRDPARRAALVHEALHGTYKSTVGAEARPPDYNAMYVLDSGAGPWPLVSDLAAARGVSPVDVIIDVSLDSDFGLFFGQPMAGADPQITIDLLRHPRCVVGASDSGAHVSQIIDSSVPTFMLAHWVRAEEAMTWEFAVRKLTFEPALQLGFNDRGWIHEGFAADLVVFDPERVAPGMPYVEHDLPAGAKRLKQEAEGILATVVNGEVLLRDNQFSDARPGRVLRGPLAKR